MNIAQMKDSKFLRQQDVGTGFLATIQSISQENVAKEGSDPENKWCVHFDELEKPLVLNAINTQLLAAITKSDETDNWPGHKVVLYTDPTISFGGKITGGIRVRAPRNQKPAPATTAPKPAPARPAPRPAPAADPGPDEGAMTADNEPSDDDVPF